MNDLVAVFESQFAQHDFPAAALTLKRLLQDNPDDAQLQIFAAHLHNVAGKPQKAEAIYRNVLKSQVSTKLLGQARQGLKIIEDAELKQQRDSIALALAQVGGKAPGFLAILPVALENRKEAAERLARIFHIDTYTALSQIPSRHLRILRIGRVGELEVYGQQLCKTGVPSVWVSLDAIAKINVYTVECFELPGIHQVRAIHSNGELTFDIKEVGMRVDGLLPTFGEVVTVDAKHQLVRKEQLLDKVRVCDLHLPQQGCILRFHDNGYQFHRGMQFEVGRSPDPIAPTVQERWSNLMRWLDGAMPEVRVKSDFVPFAEMALALPDFLEQIEPHIDLGRRKESLWDNCYQLFSGMIFMEGRRIENELYLTAGV